MPETDAVTAAVARNVKSLRAARGWSLDQLAGRSGVSKGMLVNLEQARTNPSLSTLCKLAETLGISLAGLIELHGQPRVQVVAADAAARLWTGQEGSWGDLLGRHVADEQAVASLRSHAAPEAVADLEPLAVLGEADVARHRQRAGVVVDERIHVAIDPALEAGAVASLGRGLGAMQRSQQQQAGGRRNHYPSHR